MTTGFVFCYVELLTAKNYYAHINFREKILYKQDDWSLIVLWFSQSFGFFIVYSSVSNMPVLQTPRMLYMNIKTKIPQIFFIGYIN